MGSLRQGPSLLEKSLVVALLLEKDMVSMRFVLLGGKTRYVVQVYE